jgi:hypothetical protein
MQQEDKLQRSVAAKKHRLGRGIALSPAQGERQKAGG